MIFLYLSSFGSEVSKIKGWATSKREQATNRKDKKQCKTQREIKSQPPPYATKHRVADSGSADLHMSFHIHFNTLW